MSNEIFFFAYCSPNNTRRTPVVHDKVNESLFISLVSDVDISGSEKEIKTNGRVYVLVSF